MQHIAAQLRRNRWLGVRQGDGRDDNSMRENHEATEKILKALDIEADWWPFA
jgi:hypothetical protein